MSIEPSGLMSSLQVIRERFGQFLRAFESRAVKRLLLGQRIGRQ